MRIPKHELQTPSLAFTASGLFMLALYQITHHKNAEFMAFLLFGLAGAGIAMALGSEVERNKEEWGWKGIARSLRRPSTKFWKGVIFHLPQFLGAVYLAHGWWHNQKPRG